MSHPGRPDDRLFVPLSSAAEEDRASFCAGESRVLLRLELVLPKKLPKVSEPLSSGSAATLLTRGPVVGKK